MVPHAPLWLVIVAFIGALGPLVFFHELGHYSMARLFKIPAEVFSIGFGPEITGWNDRRGTRWKLSWLPLGGYVKFVGDMSPASNPGDLDHVPPELRDHIFQVRPVWQRFIVVLAGPMANFLLAILIFTAFFSIMGAPTASVVGAVKAASPAEAAGIQSGDRILSLSGRPTPTFVDLSNETAIRPGETVILKVQRGDHLQNLRVTLGHADLKMSNGDTVQRGVLGVAATPGALKPMPVYRALPEATKQTFRLTAAIFDGLVQMIRGYVSPKQIGGPLSIANVAGDVATLGPLQFIQLLALLSINLGFINLLPVPMLDGGHLFFYGIEAVRRRPVGVVTLEWAFRGGVALILALMIFATGNDLGIWNHLQRLIG